MAHPYKSKAKTGQQIADARYSQKSASQPRDPVVADARKDTKDSDGPEETFAAAPSRQISNKGNVRK